MLNNKQMLKYTELINMILQGSKTKEIAEALKMSESGIKFHITKFYKQVKVKNRAEFIYKYYDAKIKELEARVQNG
jgi:DNA-binding NarL/FixJ family response regulator